MENQEVQWQDLEEISTATFDEAVRILAKAQEDYDQVELILKDASEKKEAARAAILDLMEKSGKSKYQLDGYGTVSRTEKYSITTPKDNDSKEKMLAHFSEKGRDFFLSYVSVNSATLNSYFNSSKEANPDFTIPGIGDPTVRQSIRFTKERIKK